MSEGATGDCGGGDSGINGLVVLVATLEMVLAQLMTEYWWCDRGTGAVRVMVLVLRVRGDNEGGANGCGDSDLLG